MMSGIHKMSNERENRDIISIIIRQSETGLYTATSDALEGVFIAHRDLAKIVEDVPNVVQRWFKLHRNEDVTVFQGPLQHLDGLLAVPTIPVLAEIAAKAMAR
jgi:hypothetical protein